MDGVLHEYIGDLPKTGHSMTWTMPTRCSSNPIIGDISVKTQSNRRPVMD